VQSFIFLNVGDIQREEKERERERGEGEGEGGEGDEHLADLSAPP